MRNIAGLPREEREALFLNTANKIKMPPAIVEKDFWVCYMLDYLFHCFRWREHLVFKGGTSLSKAYHIIQRFSEDIDLILDWRLLGYGMDEPWEERSNTQQDKFSEDSLLRTMKFLSGDFMPALRTGIAGEVPDNFDVFLESDEDPTVDFAYPQLFTDSSILQVIRLEIGAMASWSPSKEAKITSFVAEQYPQIFEYPSTMVRTAIAERTFWEKATILHREANRHSGSLPARYSRHYYDLYCMAGHQVRDNALRNIPLLQDVVRFKKKFYRCPWAKYEEAITGTMKLIPQKQYFAALEEDYAKMRQMIYGPVPDFHVVIAELTKLERDINGRGTWEGSSL